jgi:O-antigen biosynthesis protein
MGLPTLGTDLNQNGRDAGREPCVLIVGSGTPDVVWHTAARCESEFGRRAVVVSEFQPDGFHWIPYHFLRSVEENRALVLSKLREFSVQRIIVIHQPQTPFGDMRRFGRSLGLARITHMNEVGHTHLRHRIHWRVRNFFLHHLRPEGSIGKTLRVLRKPASLHLPALYRAALVRGRTLAATRPTRPRPTPELQRKPGISVVIPSRNGQKLLETCLPTIRDADEIIVVDNGSDDGTQAWLAQHHSQVIVERSADPLGFAVAMNRGLRRAQYTHVCALNNDMIAEPGFLHHLRAAFDEVPALFCASAQIFLPPGQRREETGKTVFVHDAAPLDLPVRCDIPFETEDHSYVLYGSGGCSLYDAAKLAALGGFDEIYRPAYVEDLDLGVRAWTCDWPTVYCAGARVLHQHRTTTSRYLTKEQLDLALDLNYTRFIAHAIGDPDLFQRLWNHNVLRLKALGKSAALKAATRLEATPVLVGNYDFLDLTNGRVAVFPGRRRTGNPVGLIASPYIPFPLSHGAAVRIYNLIREAATHFDVVLVAFVEEPHAVPEELLDLCVEVVTVHRPGTHAVPSRGRPDTVEEFDSPAFHAVLRQTVRKWQPKIAQLEFTQMAIYADACAPAPTLLVEHDITYDLYAQLLTHKEDWETRRQYDLWRAFEVDAWTKVTRVVTMSEKDRAVVDAASAHKAIAIGNGVDLDRFTPANDPPHPRRLLFIGSFRHHPNVLALEFFLRDVFPKLSNVTLHVIAGPDHKRYWDLQHEHVEVEGFVSDVRPAYRQASVVIAPLAVSAGTNVKIVEAMAMAKAIVSTEAGIHGLELARGLDVVVEDDPAKMAAAIESLLANPPQRHALERHARHTAETVYGWKAMGDVQRRLYEDLL